MAVPQHIGQLAHLLGVGNRLVEGDGEVVGTEDREVGVFRFLPLEGVAIDDREAVVVIFLADKAAGVLAEGADLVLEGMGIADQFGLVEHLVDKLHHFAPDLNPDADVDGAGLVGDAVFGADPLQPVGPPTPGGDNRLFRPVFGGLVPLPQERPDAAAVFDNQVFTCPAEQQLDPLLPQVVFNREVEVLGLFSAEVADRAVDQLKPGLDRPLADLLDLVGGAHPFDPGVGAEFQVDLVGIFDQLLGQARPDEVRQVAAHLVGEGELAVRKGAGSRKAGGDVAVGLAVHAVPGFVLRAVAFFHRLPLFHDGDPFPAALPEEFESGKDAGRAGADDEQVCAHKKLLSAKKPLRDGS